MFDRLFFSNDMVVTRTSWCLNVLLNSLYHEEFLGGSLVCVCHSTKVLYFVYFVIPVISWIFVPGLGRISGLAGYPVLSDIQTYFTKVIRPDIRQFSLLYQTNLMLSGRIFGTPLVCTYIQLRYTILVAYQTIDYPICM